MLNFLLDSLSSLRVIATRIYNNIFVLNGLLTHCINSNEYLYCCFVDFTNLKAFDYVGRDILWYKLIKIGVRGRMLDIIKSMYETV